MKWRSVREKQVVPFLLCPTLLLPQVLRIRAAALCGAQPDRGRPARGQFVRGNPEWGRAKRGQVEWGHDRWYNTDWSEIPLCVGTREQWGFWTWFALGRPARDPPV